MLLRYQRGMTIAFCVQPTVDVRKGNAVDDGKSKCHKLKLFTRNIFFFVDASVNFRQPSYLSPNQTGKKSRSKSRANNILASVTDWNA